MTIVDLYKQILTATVDTGAVYLRVKETLDALVADKTITKVDRSKVLSALYTRIHGDVSSLGLSVAQKVVGFDEVYTDKLALADSELAKLAAQYVKVAAEVTIVNQQSGQYDAERVAIYGGFVDSTEGALTGSGVVWNQLELAGKKRDDDAQKVLGLDAKKLEVEASTVKVLTDTARTHGIHHGDSSDIGGWTRTDGNTTFTDSQVGLAMEQSKNYARNAVSNAASAYSSIVGMAVSSQSPWFDATDKDGNVTLPKWVAVTDELKNVTVPSYGVTGAKE